MHEVEPVQALLSSNCCAVCEDIPGLTEILISYLEKNKDKNEQYLLVTRASLSHDVQEQLNKVSMHDEFLKVGRFYDGDFNLFSNKAKTYLQAFFNIVLAIKNEVLADDYTGLAVIFIHSWPKSEQKNSHYFGHIKAVHRFMHAFNIRVFCLFATVQCTYLDIIRLANSHFYILIKEKKWLALANTALIDKTRLQRKKKNLTLLP